MAATPEVARPIVVGANRPEGWRVLLTLPLLGEHSMTGGEAKLLGEQLITLAGVFETRGHR